MMAAYTSGENRSLWQRLLLLSVLLTLLLLVVVLLGLSSGAAGSSLRQTIDVLLGEFAQDSVMATIILEIRLPRVILAGVVGGTLALGGLVFQALLRNPLAEPYILGVSGGSAIGAIIGMLLGFGQFPGITLTAFGGSMLVLAVLFFLIARLGGRATNDRDSLLLGGVMLNAFCGAVIMFLISVVRSSHVQQILYWLMGDLSLQSASRQLLLWLVVPCYALIFSMARPMNLMLLGREAAATMGINVQKVSLLLLTCTTFMVSVVVSQSGLIGFVGLLVPHLFRLLVGPDHRLLVPACILGGASYLVICDSLSRSLPAEGEMPVGIITALIGAPLFIFLLWKSRR